MAHWASLLRWIWSISEYNLMTRTLESGPCDRERRGSDPAKQKPRHNPCRPVGRSKLTTWSLWREITGTWTPEAPILKLTTWSLWREITGTWTPECPARADLIVWNPKGIPKRSSKMWRGIVHHKSERKSCVLPTADRNSHHFYNAPLPPALMSIYSERNGKKKRAEKMLEYIHPRLLLGSSYLKWQSILEIKWDKEGEQKCSFCS